jgi:hypothetical protein
MSEGGVEGGGGLGMPKLWATTLFLIRRINGCYYYYY